MAPLQPRPPSLRLWLHTETHCSHTLGGVRSHLWQSLVPRCWFNVPRRSFAHTTKLPMASRSAFSWRSDNVNINSYSARHYSSVFRAASCQHLFREVKSDHTGVLMCFLLRSKREHDALYPSLHGPWNYNSYLDLWLYCKSSEGRQRCVPSFIKVISAKPERSKKGWTLNNEAGGKEHLRE